MSEFYSSLIIDVYNPQYHSLYYCINNNFLKFYTGISKITKGKNS